MIILLTTMASQPDTPLDLLLRLSCLPNKHASSHVARHTSLRCYTRCWLAPLEFNFLGAPWAAFLAFPSQHPDHSFLIFPSQHPDLILTGGLDDEARLRTPLGGA